MSGTISSVTGLHDKRLTVPNITAPLNQYREKLSTFIVRRRLCEAGLYGRITVNKLLFR